MIDRREAIDVAATLGLNPHVVEKDYVLGWVLWGISNHEALAESWVFKGGTCLKKCFFETYRFSEDLDFTLADPTQLDVGFLEAAFAEVSEHVYEQTGIELPANLQLRVARTRGSPPGPRGLRSGCRRGNHPRAHPPATRRRPGSGIP